MNIRNELLGTGRKTPSAYWTKRMLRKASLIFAPRKRGGCLPEGEARGGGFALGELPHPYPRLISYRKDILNNSISKRKQKKLQQSLYFRGYRLHHQPHPLNIRMHAVIAVSRIREEIHQVNARKPALPSHLADDGPDAFLQRLGS